MLEESGQPLELGDTANIQGDVFSGDKNTNISTGDIGVESGGRVNIADGNIYSFDSGAIVNIGLRAGDGLRAINEIVKTSQALRDTAASFRAVFQVACEQVDILSDYKELHDLLHQIQFHCYEPIQREIPYFPDERTTEVIEVYGHNLKDISIQLASVSSRQRIIENSLSWLNELNQIQNEIENSLELAAHSPEQAVKLLKKAIWRLKRLLTTEPVRINSLLIGSAHSLQLPVLLQALEALRSQSNLLPPEVTSKLELFESGLNALIRIQHTLDPLLGEHDRWQSLDTELRRINSMIDTDLMELEMSWEDVKEKVNPLCVPSTEEWAKSLQKSSQALNDSLEGNNPVKVRKAFFSFQREAGSRFFQIDDHLKTLCGELRKIGEPLADIVRSIT